MKVDEVEVVEITAEELLDLLLDGEHRGDDVIMHVPQDEYMQFVMMIDEIDVEEHI